MIGTSLVTTGKQHISDHGAGENSAFGSGGS